MFIPVHSLRITLAAAMCGFLLSAQTPEQEPDWLLLDSGFEAGALAKGPTSGWFSDDVERLVVQADEYQKLEGKRSLLVQLVDPRPKKRGMSSIAQTVLAPKPKSARRALDFSIALKSDGFSHVVLEFYTWDEKNVTTSFAKKKVTFTDYLWTTVELDLLVPKGHERIGIFVYMPSQAGGKLWLDAASLRPR